MLIPSIPNTLLESARDFAASLTECSSITEAEDQIGKIVHQIANVMMSEAVSNISGKTTYKGVRIPCECSKEARFKEYRSRFIKTLHGDVRVTRAYYRCEHCGRSYIPWDKEQGLNERVWTPRVKEFVASMCGALPYEAASKLIEKTSGLMIEESSEEEIVRDIGERLRQEEQKAIISAVDIGETVESAEGPERLYIGIDAAKAHTDGEWHDIKTAVFYTGIRVEGSEIDAVSNSHYIAAQEKSEEFGRRVYTKALQCGYGKAIEKIVIGDGAEWIWNEAGNHFTRATKIIDYWHACEHIYRLAQVLYGSDNPKGKRWAREHCQRLKERGPDSIIRAMKRRKAKDEQEKEALRLESGYFRKYRKQMNYPKYLARGMMIGSGPVESACKIVVGQRLKQSGMRWTKEGADAVLAVRTALLGGELHRIELAARAA